MRKIQNTTFISDHFESWRTCRKKFFYKHEKKLRLPEEFSKYKLGKEIHALVNYYFRGFDVQSLINSASNDVQEHWGILKDSKLLNFKPIATEWEFNSKIGDSEYWLVGRIDAILFDEQRKKYIIADWKTGQNIKQYPLESYQCKMYLYAFYNAHKQLGIDIKHEDVEFVFFKTEDGQLSDLTCYSEKIHKEIEQELLTTINNIEKEKEFPKISTEPQKTCDYCDYKSICFG